MRPHFAIAAALWLFLVLFPVPAFCTNEPVEEREAGAGEAAPVEPSPEEKADAEIGKRAAEQVAKQFNLIEDSPELPRLAAIVGRLRSSTQKPSQTYKVHVIDSAALNSFADPGG